MLAMDVNENAGSLMPRGAASTIASVLAPTGDRVDIGPTLCNYRDRVLTDEH